MSTHIIPWIAARALFPSLPPDPRQPDQHEDGRCPNEVADVCGCATVDSEDHWLFRTFTGEVPVRAEQDGPGKPWRAVVSLPEGSVYRRRVLDALRVVYQNCPPADPAAWTSIVVAAMDAAEDRATAPAVPLSSGKVEVCRRRRPVQAGDEAGGLGRRILAAEHP